MKPGDTHRPEFADVGATFGRADVAVSLVAFSVGLGGGGARPPPPPHAARASGRYVKAATVLGKLKRRLTRARNKAAIAE
jgi:hypothetical protein